MGAAVLLAGCQLRAAVDVQVDRDGGGAMTIVLEPDAALAAEAAAAGVDLRDLLTAGADALDGWSVRADGRRVELATGALDRDGLERTTAAFVSALEGPELRPLDPLRISVTDELVGVEGAAALEPTGAVTALGLEPDEAVELLRASTRYTVALTMPGPIVEHDADRVEGDRLVWDVPAGERVTFRAVAERPSAVPWVPWTAFAAGALLVLLGLAAVRRRRARSRRRHARAGQMVDRVPGTSR